jgi:hypothetical protein
MSSETVPEIPEQIRDVMMDEEIENMRNFDGWAVGTAIQLDAFGMEVERYEDAWVELFNGNGSAGEFGGVRFMAVPDGESDERSEEDTGDRSEPQYVEAYAYPSRVCADGNEPCYCIETWDEPEQPEIGPKYPKTPGVTR